MQENFLKIILRNIDNSGKNVYYHNCSQIEAWLSLVERCVRDAEVAGSNPVASTERKHQITEIWCFLLYFLNNLCPQSYTFYTLTITYFKSITVYGK